MPPKNKGASKKAAKARTPTLIDGLTKEELSKEQLKEHIVRLREELDREREERNYFQLERDRIHTFWDCTEREGQEVMAQLKNMDQATEEDEWRHQVEIKVYKQKMKHLLCEHQNTISEFKAFDSLSTDARQKEQAKLEIKLHKEMTATMADMLVSNENLVKELKLKHHEEIAETRDRFEKQLTDIQATNEEKMEFLSKELEEKRKNELSEREDHWNRHIAGLIEDQNNALKAVNECVSDIPQVLDNCDSLKAQIKEMKMQLKKKKDLIPVTQDNKHLAEYLSKVKEEIAEKEKKIYRIKKINSDTHQKLKEAQLSDLKKNHEAMKQKFNKLQLERDELYKTFPEIIEREQHRAGLKSALLETKLKSMTDHLEKTQAQLLSVLSASNMDQTALCELTKNIEESLDSSNNAIKDSEFKKAKISKAREDLMLLYETKLRALGVPVEETVGISLARKCPGQTENESK
ncbi:growth arrest-specific protein 8-like [Solea senegalensis]|uniref:Dynein regulatory complex subunit 4 n=1 Tax=Solea senegalensis TaxID=28829 RepID=A0AAV6S9B4_SOLSE|nr:dynein regulatory complex subunit 4-like [Solea senegalensis]KAG7513799.1 growth arrest-specific protein 8-like [Solea senegalensis]